MPVPCCHRRAAQWATWMVVGLVGLGLNDTFAQGVASSAKPNSSAQSAIRPLPPVQPGAYYLTLDDARQRALSTNKAVTLARLNAEGKRYATSAARKDYLPKVLGSVSYFHFDNPLGSVVTTRGVILPSTTIQANVLNQNTAFSTALVAQPITKLIAVHAAVQVSRADENIAQAKLDQGTRQVLSGVTQAYYGLIGAQRIHAALELQATMLKQLVAANPSPELRVSYLELRQGLLQVQGEIQEVTDQINDLLDFPPGTALQLADPVPPMPRVASAEQAAQMALSCNPEMREASQDIAKAEAGLKVARMGYIPDVNVVGGYANQTGATYIQPNFTYLGVTATHTFWEWGKKNDLCRQREADVAMAHQNFQVVSNKVQLEARKAYVAFEQALQGYQLAREMKQAYQDAEQGVGNPAAIMAAKAATGKAELEAMKAEINYRVTHAQLAAATGSE